MGHLPREPRYQLWGDHAGEHVHMERVCTCVCSRVWRDAGMESMCVSACVSVGHVYAGGGECVQVGRGVCVPGVLRCAHVCECGNTCMCVCRWMCEYSVSQVSPLPPVMSMQILCKCRLSESHSRPALPPPPRQAAQQVHSSQAQQTLAPSTAHRTSVPGGGPLQGLWPWLPAPLTVKVVSSDPALHSQAECPQAGPEPP